MKHSSKTKSNCGKNQRLAEHVILIVEDSPTTGTIVRAVMKREGFHTEWVTTGKKALAWLSENQCTLMLLDYELPDMTGQVIVESLAEQGRQMPFIIMTAHTDQRLVVQMMKLGARDYLIKEEGFNLLLPSVVSKVIEHLETDKKLAEAEQELRKSEKRFKLAVEGSNDGLWDWPDVNQDTEWWSPRFYDVLGYKDGAFQATHSKFKKLLHPEDRTRTLEALKAHFENRIPFDVEYRLKTKSGTYRWLRGRGLAAWDKEGYPLRMSGSVQDIHERRQREDRLRLQNAALEAAANAVVITDREGCISWVNPAFTNLTGFSRDEAFGKKPNVFKSGKHDDKFYKSIWETVLAGKVWHGEIVNQRKDGSLYDEEMTITPLVDDNGDITNFITIKQDITNRKRTEKVLEEAHAQTEQLLASISSIMIGVGSNDRVTRWSTAAENAFGIHACDVIGRAFVNCGINWDWSTVFEHITYCRDRDKPTRLDDIRFTRPSGKEGFLSITINPIAREGTEHAGYLLLAADITERKILESQLSQAQKLESIGQLAAGIAHEINTPTQYIGDNTRFLKIALGKIENVLLKYHELLTAAKQNTVSKELIAEVEMEIKNNRMEYILEQIPQAIEEALVGIERVGKIVKAMKEYSHPGGEEKTPVDINKALENTITVCRNEWKYYADLEKDFAEDLPLVPALPGELNQVFLNMIVNAAHAIADAADEDSGKQGVIRVSTHHQKKDWVEVKISDTGTGIPEAHRSKVFDPFFTTKEVGKGTGQGLAISHNVVVDKHCGSITFDTEEGKGTTFVIRLPTNFSN